jgi:uncharacterized RDD family membrane protein YckC
VAPLDTLQTIELAGGVQILLRPAGPLPRALAFMLDLLFCALILIVGSLLLFFMGMFMGFTGVYVLGGLGMLMFFIVYWGYFVLFEVLRKGQTPGKKSLGLRVVRSTGARVGWGAGFLRNLLRFADMMPLFGAQLMGFYLFGTTSCLATRRFQRLGDLIADTVVIYDRQEIREGLLKSRSPIAPERPPLLLTREEEQAFIEFAERASLWSDSRKEEVVAPLAAILGVSGREGVLRALAIGAWIRDS